MKKKLTISIPCFNEELNVIPAYHELKKEMDTLKNFNYEFIFVDNRSTDNTREKIKQLAQKDRSIIGIFLSRNFGPDVSGEVALRYGSGDAYIIYQCDMQDPSSIIPKFIRKWEEGYDIVVGIYTKTEDILFMRLMRRSFYKLLKMVSNIEIPINAGAFGLIDKKAVRVLNEMPERYRFFRGLRAWVGFKTAYVTYERRKRQRGKSSYNFFSYMKHAERSFFGFSYIPLDMIIYAGLMLVLFSFLFILIYILIAIIYGNPIKGSITILVTVVFLGGIQLLALSVIGKYIQVIVEETKARPLYIVDEIISKNTKIFNNKL